MLITLGPVPLGLVSTTAASSGSGGSLAGYATATLGIVVNASTTPRIVDPA